MSFAACVIADTKGPSIQPLLSVAVRACLQVEFEPRFAGQRKLVLDLAFCRPEFPGAIRGS